jgi:sulfane dehydrogenase subunit SoxC
MRWWYTFEDALAANSPRGESRARQGESMTLEASTTRTIIKPLPTEKFVDFRDGGSTHYSFGDLALNAEMRWEAMADQGYMTPNELFFIRSHAPTPRLDPSTWTLRVEGPGVERALVLGYNELLQMSSVSVVRALECAGNGRVFFKERQEREATGTPWRLGAIGVAEWTGVPLREILELAGLKKSAREVMLESLDAVRMRRPLPVQKALEESTLLALGMNGEVLPPDHGFPARVVVPGWAAVATAQVPKSALELPWPATLRRGRHVITGRSWSPDAAVAQVEYTVDGDTEWHLAELFGSNVPGAWARWRFTWEALPGMHELRVRATDAAGNVQPEEVVWNELGYLYGGVVRHPVEVL